MDLLKEKIKEMYPFQGHFYCLKGQFNMHYVDEGPQDETKKVIVLLHGNPTWSFYYRNLIRLLAGAGYRVIAPDHIGCGLSDKPSIKEFPFTLASHIQNVKELLEEHLQLKEFSLVLHDWGGAIGMGLAKEFSQAKISGIVLMNTAAFTSKQIPWRIFIGKVPFLGEFLIKRLNLFARAATIMTTQKKLSTEIKEAYLAPYLPYENRTALYEFVQDIPLYKGHRSFKTLQGIEDFLPSIKCPKLLLWGAKDFCFHLEFLQKWREFYPHAPYTVYEEAGHYLLEDEGEKAGQQILKFFQERYS